MKLLEYHGKELFSKYHIIVPNGKIVKDEKDFSNLCFPLVLKAQVPVGGRGKAGGIKSAENLNEAKKQLNQILNSSINGYKVGKVLAEEKTEIKKELYLSISIDRRKRMPCLIASNHGGVDIESVPDNQIFKDWINPLIGIQPYNISNILSKLELKKDEIENAVGVFSKLYKLFRDYDCELVEINPLIIDSKGNFMALDSKIMINDDSLFRHTDLKTYDDELTTLEKEAKEKDIAFVQLNGNIGVIANGAGLTMASLDALTYFKGKGGVFLDLGGTDDPNKVIQALQLMKKAKPRVILLNLFGGITKCDTVAKAVKTVIDNEGFDCPVVARIKGVNEDVAKEILKNAGFITASTLQNAAERCSNLAREK